MAKWLTDRQLAAYHRRRLTTISKQLEAMSAEWEERDMFNAGNLSDASRACLVTANSLADAAEVEHG